MEYSSKMYDICSRIPGHITDGGGMLATLKPQSTTPKNVRTMETHPLIVDKIRALREKRPRLGKEKIKPLLDKYCQKKGIIPIAQSTIGKVIKRNHFLF